MKSKLDLSQSVIIASRNMLKARRAAHLTRAALAEMSGVSRSCIEQWEKGKTVPTVLLCDMVAAALDLTIDEYINGKVGE